MSISSCPAQLFSELEMAAANSPAPAASVRGFRLPPPHRVRAPALQSFARLSPSRPVRRLVNARGLQMKKLGMQRPAAAASDSKTPDSGTGKNSRSGSSSSPPLLTVFAGLLVFLLVLWITGSLLVWLVGLIIHPPSP